MAASLTPYLLLAVAIAVEVVATSALKASEGFARLVPSIVVVAGYALSFFLLSITLKTLPVSLVYAIWSGLGTVGVAVVGFAWFGEPLGWLQAAGIALIVGGVVLLKA